MATILFKKLNEDIGTLIYKKIHKLNMTSLIKYDFKNDFIVCKCGFCHEKFYYKHMVKCHYCYYYGNMLMNPKHGIYRNNNICFNCRYD